MRLKQLEDVHEVSGMWIAEQMREYFGREVTVIPGYKTLMGNLHIKEDNERWVWHPSWFVDATEVVSDWGFGI